MNNFDSKLQKSLGNELSVQGLELVDLVPVPKHGDRMVKFRTVQECLNDFEALGEEESSQTYLVHVRKRPPAPQTSSVSMEPDSEAPAERNARSSLSSDGIYLANGKLNAPYLLDNARLLMAAGEYASARQIYTTLKNAGTETAQALFGIARCLEAEGRIEDAIRHYDESILYHPSLEAYQRYAALLIRAKRDQQASEVIERALHLKEIPAKTRFELEKAAGNCCLRAGLHARAERHYQAALDLDPRSDAIAANLGLLYAQQGKTPQAEAAFRDCLRANPQNDQALSGLAMVHLSQNQYAEAHDAFASALRINLNQPKAIFHLVKCAYRIKRFETACDLLSEYIQIAPFNANLLYSLAGLQYHLGRKVDARRTISQILSIQPNHAEARNLGALLDRQEG